MKKIAAIVAVLALGFAFAVCADQRATAEPTPPPAVKDTLVFSGNAKSKAAFDKHVEKDAEYKAFVDSTSFKYVETEERKPVLKHYSADGDLVSTLEGRKAINPTAKPSKLGHRCKDKKAASAVKARVEDRREDRKLPILGTIGAVLGGIFAPLVNHFRS